MKTLYRIYTEDVGRVAILYVMNAHYDAYTLIPCKGYWAGESENALIIEILTTDDISHIRRIVQYIKDQNKQQSVLITSSLVESELV
jgi:hypothetical protein